MNKKIFRIGLITLSIVFLTIFFGGCTSFSDSFRTNANFVYPNSNVEPLGKVQASFKKGGFLFPPKFTPADIDALYKKAMEQKGGDILINAKVRTKTTLIPLYLIQIYIVEWTVEGTACKMEVGMQKLE